MSEVPGNLKYTNQHEWVKIDGEVATLGISDYAQQFLGEITYVELPEVGQEIDAGGGASRLRRPDVLCPQPAAGH